MVDPPHIETPRINALVADLTMVTPLIPGIVPIPGTDIELTVLVPRSIDALLDDAAADPEDHLPYWAEIWPSGIALASEVLRNPTSLKGISVLELGCGVGITAAAAMTAGAHLVATDYSPHSLNLTALTCLQAGQQVPDLREVNWRDPAADVLQRNGEPWPLVLAADVLYEKRDIEPVLAVLERITAPGGAAWIAEPGRSVARAAVEIARKQGWRVESRTWRGPWHGANTVNAEVTVHRMTKPAPGD